MKPRSRATAATLACLLGHSPVQAHELELAAQTLATLSVDDRTRGGGVGLAIALGAPLLEQWLGTPGQLVAAASVGALTGAGVAWAVEGGVAYRFLGWDRWQPEAGLSVLWLGGDLVRTIDDQGGLAGDPWALRFGISPLRFRLEDGWVSLLGVRAGPTLFRSGRLPLSLSLTLFEVGTRL
jgi:hypothetical protein